jgi:hypothetical protein
LLGLLHLLRSGSGTFRSIECLEIRSADWGIPDQLGAGS